MEDESKGIGRKSIKIDVLGSSEVEVEGGTAESGFAEDVEEEKGSTEGVSVESCASETLGRKMEIGQDEDSVIRSGALDKGRDKGGDSKDVDEGEKGKIDS